MGAEYKALSGKEMEKYVAMADADKERSKKEREDYASQSQSLNHPTESSSKKKSKSKKSTTPSGRMDSQGRWSQSLPTNVDADAGDFDAGLQQYPQEMLTSTATGRRNSRKKRSSEYEWESDGDEDYHCASQNTRSSTMRAAPKRSKLFESESNVPLDVDTSTKPKSQAPKKKTKKAAQTPAPRTKSARDDSQVKPIWVPCENPWGPSGYQEGDVVLVTPLPGSLTSHENIYSGPRFSVSPFASDFDYGNTHKTPSEGFDVILLTRDPNAQHPWGFTYRRHEFGGACLIVSTDPLSPAASAVRFLQ